MSNLINKAKDALGKGGSSGGDKAGGAGGQSGAEKFASGQAHNRTSSSPHGLHHIFTKH